MGKDGQEEKLCKGVHRRGLGVDAASEGRSRPHLQQELRLTADDRQEGGVQLQLPQPPNELLLLSDHLLLTVEAGRHDGLLAETEKSGLHR